MRTPGRRPAACIALAMASSAFAHHAARYDDTRIVEVHGVVTAVAWQNPHVVLQLREETGDAIWRLEGTSANALARWGIPGPERLPIGASVIVRGPVTLDDEHAMIAATVRLSDGEQLVLWPGVAARLGLAATVFDGLFPPPAPTIESMTETRSGIFRVWTPRGQRPAAVPGELLTEQARMRAASYDPRSDDPALRCIPPGMPGIMDTAYPIEFTALEDRILVRLEEWDAERTIFLRPGAGPSVQDPSPLGVSFGRWEGDTLAVFTTYIDYPYADARGTPQGSQATVLERYTPKADYTKLGWTITVTDASTFVSPWVRHGEFMWEPGESIKPYNCMLTEPRTEAAEP